jgi:alkanesulfonate monooxygenase SsuD/methylene tetrahydromethanopterin reductase-like flavin-dependent oxidoreductase (luciferase family)
MIFDLFHSISDPEIKGKRLAAPRVYQQFLDQAVLAEKLGMDTIWCAESHFSSETQKKTSVATIPHFYGEVGINSDSFQLAHLIFQRTRKIHFGTAIHNIVGGSGGPIASADRVNSLNAFNQMVLGGARKLRIGVAAGRFPYQNTPFGIQPRSEIEKDLWADVKRYIFIEALEIFLRLLGGETLNSQKVKTWEMAQSKIQPRWVFEDISLVPEVKNRETLDIVLGSQDSLALEWGLKWWDLSVFNLSFTSPEKIELLHQNMQKKADEQKRKWARSRLPRTVLVFIDKDRKKAYDLASEVLDAYIEAMRGTAQVPDKEILLSRALVGDPSEIREQLDPLNPRGFKMDDRLMLWFEFNQLDGLVIENQMKLFIEKVVS